MADTLCNNLYYYVCVRGPASERAKGEREKQRERERERERERAHEFQWISHIEIAGKGDLMQNNQVNIMSKDIIKLLIINIQFTFIQPTKGTNIDHMCTSQMTQCV